VEPEWIRGGDPRGRFHQAAATGLGAVTDAGRLTLLLIEGVMAVAILGVLIFGAVYIARDMNRRGQPGALYAVFFLLTGPIGFVFWLLVHDRYPRGNHS
jgi:hypothetical protein